MYQLEKQSLITDFNLESSKMTTLSINSFSEKQKQYLADYLEMSVQDLTINFDEISDLIPTNKKQVPYVMTPAGVAFFVANGDIVELS